MQSGTGVLAKVTRPDGTLAAPVLARLLELTSDAVICFDGTGAIHIANDEAMRLLAPIEPGGERESLVGTDVRQLFAVADDALDAPFSTDCLPVRIDGSDCPVSRTSVHGQPMNLIVRCERIGALQEAYVLVVRPEGQDEAVESERERLFEELSRANRRLVGTLDIVLGTLDSPNVSTLFERVLEELRNTMDASGTTMYLAASDGFRLQGVSASLEDRAVPRFLPRSCDLMGMLMRSEMPLCLETLSQEGEYDREGAPAIREVRNQRTQEVYQVDASQLPPFATGVAVPVRFGGRIIALLQVGWRNPRAVPYDDIDLLDAVARYLAVQLVGAFSALRTQRHQQLAQRANDLRDRVVLEASSPERDQMVLDAVERDLDCVCAPVLDPHAGKGERMVRLPLSGREEGIAQDLLDAHDPVTVLTSEDALSTWLRERDERCLGAMVGCDTVDDERLSFLALRPDGSEPFDELELDYLRQVNETVRAVETDEHDRKRDKRIAKALQAGMRNDLQEVPGITAQGAYSSATEAAQVGGDFYTLIRMPKRHACVIMGDVSGKGVGAASVSAAVRTALGAYAWEGLPPAKMVSHLNDLLLGFSNTETFASLFVGIVDLAQGELVYCSAGHPPALLWRPKKRELEWLSEQSGVVGAFHDMTYRDGHAALNPGDVLFLYTDGTTEARAADGSFFGEAGLGDALIQEVERGFEGLVKRMMGCVEDFTGRGLEDDVAMVALRFDRVGE